MAVMPWPRPLRPPSRQSKPSTRTAGWKTRAQPVAERGDAMGEGAGRGVGRTGTGAGREVGRTATGAGVTCDITGHHGMGLPGRSIPNRLSLTTGFDARRGGEPQNSGGCGDAAERLLSSPCQDPEHKRQRPVGEKIDSWILRRGGDEISPLTGGGRAGPCRRRSAGTGEARPGAEAWGRRAGSSRRRRGL
jgi:hypothetical protein